MIGDDIARLFEPPGGKLVEHLSFVRHARQDAVEGGQAVGGDEQAFAVRQVVPVAHLAGLFSGQRQVRFIKA